jgi:CHASE2 domain-containing sensor protein/signal transduction histidine kinase
LLPPNAEPPGQRPWPRRLLVEWLLVGALLSALVIGLGWSGASRRLDDLAYDFTVTRRPLPVPGDVIIIAIDEASLDSVGPWPWPRDVHAAAIDRLNAAGARVIGYDVLFLEPGEGDAELSAAAQRSGKTFLPMQFRVPGRDGRSHDALVPGVAGARVGHATVIPDGDGVVRTVDLAVDGEQRWLHVAALVAGVPPLPAFEPRAATLPLARVETRLVGFRGGAGQFRRVSFAALLDGEVPRALLRGRTVLVGATAPGLGDLFSTPGAGRSGIMPGVELQANVVGDLMAGKTLQRAPAWGSVVLALVMLWACMLGLLRLPPPAAALFGAALVGLLALVVTLLFAQFGLWIGPAPATVGLLLAQPVWAWRRLGVVNRWMTDEIATLGQAVGRTDATADPVTRTTQLLAAAIDRVEDLRELADAAIRGLPDATLLVDRAGAIVGANTAAEALFGADPGLLAVDAVFAGHGLPAFGATTLVDPASPWRGEHRARGGSIRDIRFTPWRDSKGAPLGWIVRFADITALRRAEQVREEALQLLTHDMRAPQATILALVDGEPDLDPALADRLRHLARRTIALADGYLQLARADAGGYTMEEVDLAAIVTEAVDELWPQSQAKGIKLAGEGLDGEALVIGNYQLLLRAAVNLVGNAVKFAPAASVVNVRLSEAAQGWQLDVIDSGPGIPADVQTRLFGRFRSGPQTAGGGVGLGLAFVRSVADGHGGTVACQSSPGAGARFTLWLPRPR